METRRLCGLTMLTPRAALWLEVLVEGFQLAPPLAWTREAGVWYGEARRSQAPYGNAGKQPCAPYGNEGWFPGTPGEDAEWPAGCDYAINLTRAWTRWPTRLVHELARGVAGDRALFIDRAVEFRDGSGLVVPGPNADGTYDGVSGPYINGGLTTAPRVAVSDAPADAGRLGGPTALWALWAATPGYLGLWVEAELRRAAVNPRS